VRFGKLLACLRPRFGRRRCGKKSRHVHAATPGPGPAHRRGEHDDRRRERGTYWAFPKSRHTVCPCKTDTFFYFRKEWARRTFLDSGCNAVTDFDALANAAPSGSDGVLFLPHLNGERSPFADPTARGAFINLSPASTKKHLCRSVLEGVGYHYRGLFDALEMPMDSPDFGETNGASPGVPFLGGGANSAVWTQVIADCARRKLVTVGSDASLVAARGCSAGAFVYLNLWGAGNKAPAGYFPFDGGNDVSDASITQDLSPKKESKVFLPNQSAAAGHDAAYLVWARLHKALAEAGARVSLAGSELLEGNRSYCQL
jgi:ribulose kinase